MWGGGSFNIHTHLHCRRETVSVISTDPRCKDQNARLTTVPYPEKLLSDINKNFCF